MRSFFSRRLIEPSVETDSLRDMPLVDYRYNHRYPFLLHRDALCIHVPVKDSGSTCSAQARLTSASP
ncbi:MAG: hypothetical protein JZU65_10710, partial [Chlorobium sp.]|nr:hypothetical protein [Chlorobium sp.]